MKTVGSITLLEVDVKPKIEVKTENQGYGRRGSMDNKVDYTKARYMHADGSLCRSEQRKHAEKEMELPDLPNSTVTEMEPIKGPGDNEESDTAEQCSPVEKNSGGLQTGLNV